MREAGSRERIEKGKIKLNARVTRLFSASPFAPCIYIRDKRADGDMDLHTVHGDSIHGGEEGVAA